MNSVREVATEVDRQLGDPPVFRPPNGFTLTTPWQRAQTEADLGGPVDPAHRQVFLEESTNPHRVLFAIKDGELRAECDLDGKCPAYRFDDWCAHIASCWWQ